MKCINDGIPSLVSLTPPHFDYRSFDDLLEAIEHSIQIAIGSAFIFDDLRWNYVLRYNSRRIFFWNLLLRQTLFFFYRV